MTRTTNARIAGSTFLLYIAAGITSLVLSGRATSGEGIAEKFASIAQHAMEMRIVVLLSLLMWLPMLVYEVALSAWLLIKGVAMPSAATLRLGQQNILRSAWCFHFDAQSVRIKIFAFHSR